MSFKPLKQNQWSGITDHPQIFALFSSSVYSLQKMVSNYLGWVILKPIYVTQGFFEGQVEPIFL